jgi:HAE1 family hydrophobic/amphiphilic exporter-1
MRQRFKGFFIPKLAVRRPVTVTMLLVASIVIGVIAYQRIALQLLPSGFTPPFLYVSIPTVPSTPADVEREIVEPVEDILRTVRNVHSVRSRAEQSDAGFFISFNDGTNMDVAYNQVRDRLERVRPQLPEEAERWAIWKFDPEEDPLMFIGVRVEGDSRDPDRLLDQELVRPLERLPEVSRVDTRGTRPLNVVVEVDDKRANAAGVSVAELIETLREDNYNLSAGVIDEGGERFPLRVLARIDDVEELENLPIGNGLELGDVARVGLARSNTDEVFRINGSAGYVLAVYKESSQNTVATAEAIRNALQRLVDTEAGKGIEVEVFFDQGQVIEDSLSNLTDTALWGGLFAIIILFLFLRRARMTFVTAAAIPLSMMMTLTMMYFWGASLNALSLMGFMLSVGMVVDNSIVVTEAIQRRRLEGEPIRQASPNGAGEVGLAILVATSTTIVVFLPMVLMSGSETISFYLAKIGFPVCMALIASLVVSLIFIPLSLTWIDTDDPPPTVALIERIQDAYVRALRWCLRHRGTAVVVIAALMGSIAYPAEELQRTDQLEANINDVRVRFEYEPAATFEERLGLLTEYETWVEAHREELEVRTWMTRLSDRGERGEIRLFLEDVNERQLSRDEVVKKIREGLPHLAGSNWRIGWSSPGAQKKVTVDVEGENSERLARIADAAAVRLRRLEGVQGVLVGEDDARALELHYQIDDEAAQRTGVSPMMIGGAIDYALRGRRVGEIDYRGESLPLWIQTDRRTTQSRETLDNLSLPSPLGGPGVPIGDLTTTSVARGYNEITHMNGRTQIEIQVLTTRQDLDRLGREIDAVIAGIEMPRGYGIEKGERFRQLQSDAQEREFALMLAIVFVFLLMGILFESFILPFVIVLSIPFAFLGVYWTLYLTGTSFDVMAGVGLIILVGIVVNNAIVLVDRVNVLIAQSGDRETALLEAGRVRLRPITMTALTTIGGLIPMAIGASEIVGVPYAPLGRTVIGGLLASTVLTLFVVPIFYTLIDDLRRWAAQFVEVEEPPAT